MSILLNLLLVIHVLVSLLIVLLVLMQRPKNEGLGAAFGGGMTENLFGAGATNVLGTATRWLGGIFFGLTLLLSYLHAKHSAGKTGIEQRLSAKTTVPAAPAAAPVSDGLPATPTLLDGAAAPADATTSGTPAPEIAAPGGAATAPTPEAASAPMKPGDATNALAPAPQSPVDAAAPAASAAPLPAPATPVPDPAAPAPAAAQ